MSIPFFKYLHKLILAKSCTRQTSKLSRSTRIEYSEIKGQRKVHNQLPTHPHLCLLKSVLSMTENCTCTWSWCNSFQPQGVIYKESPLLSVALTHSHHAYHYIILTWDIKTVSSVRRDGVLQVILASSFTQKYHIHCIDKVRAITVFIHACMYSWC